MSKISYKRILLYVLILVILILFFPNKLRADAPIPPEPIKVERPVPSVKGYKPFTEEQTRIWYLVVDAFPNAPIMPYVALSESRLDEKIPNPSSSARGVFQILKSTWNCPYKEKGQCVPCIGDVLKAEDNIMCAQKLYAKFGTSPWNESKGTWGKYVSK